MIRQIWLQGKKMREERHQTDLKENYENDEKFEKSKDQIKTCKCLSSISVINWHD